MSAAEKHKNKEVKLLLYKTLAKLLLLEHLNQNIFNNATTEVDAAILHSLHVTVFEKMQKDLKSESYRQVKTFTVLQLFDTSHRCLEEIKKSILEIQQSPPLSLIGA